MSSFLSRLNRKFVSKVRHHFIPISSNFFFLFFKMAWNRKYANALRVQKVGTSHLYELQMSSRCSRFFWNFLKFSESIWSSQPPIGSDPIRSRWAPDALGFLNFFEIFREYLENAPECFRMLPNASECFRMLPNASERFQMHQNAFNCFQMLSNAIKCGSQMFSNAVRKCFQMHSNAFKCFQMLPKASKCFKLLQNVSDRFRMLPNASKCFQMLPDASRCFRMLQNAPECFPCFYQTKV